jgi:hypothetical protein
MNLAQQTGKYGLGNMLEHSTESMRFAPAQLRIVWNFISQMSWVLVRILISEILRDKILCSLNRIKMSHVFSRNVFIEVDVKMIQILKASCSNVK